MNNMINSFFKKLANSLNLNNEPTAEEKLAQFIKDYKHMTLLDRIKAIRQNSDYIPDYNKPKVYTDVVIMYQENPNEDFKPINHTTTTTCQRPIDFNNDIKAWKRIVQLDNKKAEKERKEKEAAFQKMWEQRIENFNKAIAVHMKVY